MGVSTPSWTRRELAREPDFWFATHTGKFRISHGNVSDSHGGKFSFTRERSDPAPRVNLTLSRVNVTLLRVNQKTHLRHPEYRVGAAEVDSQQRTVAAADWLSPSDNISGHKSNRRPRDLECLSSRSSPIILDTGQTGGGSLNPILDAQGAC